MLDESTLSVTDEEVPANTPITSIIFAPNPYTSGCEMKSVSCTARRKCVFSAIVFANSGSTPDLLRDLKFQTHLYWSSPIAVGHLCTAVHTIENSKEQFSSSEASVGCCQFSVANSVLPIP